MSLLRTLTGLQATASAPCSLQQSRHKDANRLLSGVIPAGRPSRGASRLECVANGKQQKPASKPEDAPAKNEAISSMESKTDVLSFSLAPEGHLEFTKNGSSGLAQKLVGKKPQPFGHISHPNIVRTTGLRRTPLGGGVKNATQRYDLPPPSVAVRNLVERAHFAHLCTVMSKMHHRRAHYPFGTLVDFACDGAGYPILCLSPLGIHTRNLSEDPRSSIVVQMPGWTGLANARVTIFGDVYRVPAEMQDMAREIFTDKHASDKRDKWVAGNFVFFRMHRITDIYFVGGFGTLQWVDVQEYIHADPDAIVMDRPERTIQVLNERFGPSLNALLSLDGASVDDAHIISIDRLGADVRLRKGSDYSVERIGFRHAVECLDDVLRQMDMMFVSGSLDELCDEEL